MSFRGRFVGAISAVNLATLAVAFVAIGELVDASQERQFDDALRRESLEEVAEIADSGGRRLRISPRAGPSPDDIGPLTKYAVLYAEDGAVLDVTESWMGRPPALSDLSAGIDNLWFGDLHLRGMVSPIPNHPGTALLLAAPRSDLDGDSRYLRRAMAVAFGLSILLTVALTSGVVRRLTQVHERIALVARRVSAQDMSARVGEVRGDGEIVQLAGDIDRMIDRIELLLRNQTDFITHAAHELRSPLTALYGELSHALRRSRDADQYREAIDEALDATRRLMALADDLLALARIGRVPDLQPVPVNLGEICREALAMVAREAEAGEVEVELRVEPMQVLGEPMDLVRLVRNLLENAIGHAPANSRVELDGSIDGALASLRVRDYGTGITPDDAERIFQPFFRGSRERASQRPGSGLGLAIAGELAKQYGGTLELAEVSGPGACFVVRLPRVC
jgi:two-component system, OmpR family, sensor kinase